MVTNGHMILFTFSFNAFPLFLSFTPISLCTFTLELYSCFRKVRKNFSYLLWSSRSWVRFFLFYFFFEVVSGFMIVELYICLIISLSTASHEGISNKWFAFSLSIIEFMMFLVDSLFMIFVGHGQNKSLNFIWSTLIATLIEQQLTIFILIKT